MESYLSWALFGVILLILFISFICWMYESLVTQICLVGLVVVVYWDTSLRYSTPKETPAPQCEQIRGENHVVIICPQTTTYFYRVNTWR